jgi:hypothetical protein
LPTLDNCYLARVDTLFLYVRNQIMNPFASCLLVTSLRGPCNEFVVSSFCSIRQVQKRQGPNHGIGGLSNSCGFVLGATQQNRETQTTCQMMFICVVLFVRPSPGVAKHNTFAVIALDKRDFTWMAAVAHIAGSQATATLCIRVVTARY